MPSARTDTKRTYAPLTPALAFQLAAPQTWAAAIVAVAFSFTYAAVTYSGTLNPLHAFLLLCISVLMQSAVNVFDDYFDYKKGTDTLENSSEDKFDAVLVYNNVNPKSVLALAIAYLAAAGAMGVYLVVMTDLFPLFIGIIGALTVVLYAGGKTPLSHLPIGELVSGFVMGGLIPLASCYILSGCVMDPFVLLYSLPIMWGIGMINATNNTCDVEKDQAVLRDTLAVRLGRPRANQAYKAGIVLWVLIIVALVAAHGLSALPFVALMLLGPFPILRAILSNPLVQASRTAAMSQIVSLNVIFCAFYCLCLAIGPTITWIA